jgi:hypothetical protein
VSRKHVEKLQQRIETLEALHQKAVDQSAWRQNGDGSTATANAPLQSADLRYGFARDDSASPSNMRVFV